MLLSVVLNSKLSGCRYPAMLEYYLYWKIEYSQLDTESHRWNRIRNTRGSRLVYEEHKAYIKKDVTSLVLVRIVG
jgi:hypothetical protein